MLGATGNISHVRFLSSLLNLARSQSRHERAVSSFSTILVSRPGPANGEPENHQEGDRSAGMKLLDAFSFLLSSKYENLGKSISSTFSPLAEQWPPNNGTFS
jgi:hypothetical protein